MAASTVALAKSTMRKHIRERVASITMEERARQSAIVTRKVLDSDVYKSSRRVCLYLSMPDEINTMDILRDLLGSSSGKECFVPRYTQTDMQMLRLYSMADYEGLPLTKWSIKQPEMADNREEALASGGLDLILVPGLAFTPEGHRLGRGKGYYDKYLEKCNNHPKSPTTIALAFKEQVVDHIPSSPHDILIQHVIYE